MAAGIRSPSASSGAMFKEPAVYVLIDLSDGAVVGIVNSADYAPGEHQEIVPAPDGFMLEQVSEWAFADGVLTHDPAVALARAQSTRIAAIKTEAAAHLDASAWRLERAREREQAGWEQVADVAAVLAEREAVRRSSNAAEAAVLELTDLADVQAFAWAPDDVPVPAPRLLTHEQFIQRFTDAEWQAMTDAARTNAAMDSWIRRFALATVINLDDAATQAGVQALEMVGVLAAGRATEVLA